MADPDQALLLLARLREVLDDPETAASEWEALDSPDALRRMIAAGAEHNWLDVILTTHSHHDHVGALAEMVSATGARTAAGAEDAKEIAEKIDLPLAHGDVIEFDIPNRRVNLLVDDEELVRRRAEQDAKGWAPAAARPRQVTPALKIFAKFAQSADKGAARKVD